jgi:methionyl-tRNA formyltransferase
LDIIYFGSSDFSVPFLERLADSSHKVTGVFTYRDKEKGRGRKVHANPVKECAAGRGLKVYEISGFDEELYREISSIPFDYSIVVSFGMILPPEVFKRWPDVWINVHPSLLPAHRGPSPMVSALLDGATRTGVTINGVVYEVDTGSIYAQTSFNIEENDNLDSLEEKAVKFGAPLLIAVLDLIEDHGYGPHPQGNKGVTHTRKITPGDLKIDWTLPAAEIFNRIRAFSSRPGAHTKYEGLRLKVLGAVLTGETAKDQEPGTVTAAHRSEGLIVVCGDGRTLKLEKLQPPGKNPMDSRSFINGYRIKAGTILGKD